jgi:hypothetical protein
MIVGAVTCFLGLAVLLGFIVIGAKGGWMIKAPLIVIVPSLAVLLWFTLESIMGWPVETMPSGKYDVYAAIIEEPNKSKGIEGSICLWVTRRKTS